MDQADVAGIIEKLNAEEQVDHTLDAVAARALESIPQSAICSVFIRRGTDDVVQHATTDRRAQHLDELQLRLAEGPCLHLTSDHEVQRVRDTAREERWPRWAGEAAELGIRTALSARLPLEGNLDACLNFYAETPDAFDDDAVDVAVIYARLAAVAVQNVWETVGLRGALHGRLVIGVAQGILMQQYGITLDQSFEVLRRRSNETNTRLRELAAQIVEISDPSAFGGSRERPSG